METVTFDGIDYVKASVAAKQFGYTSDYVGQLCRSKKIDARLVGRTWFVNTDSIVEHRNNKHSKQKSLKKETFESKDKAVKAVKTKIEVAPVIKSKTLKSIISSVDITNESKTQRKLKVSYELDEESLLPTINKKYYKAPISLRINHVDAKKVKVSGSDSGKSKVSYTPNELPDVALSGKLSVEGLAESEAKEEKETNKSRDNEKTFKKKDKTKAKKVVVKPTKYSIIRSVDTTRKVSLENKDKEEKLSVDKFDKKESTKIQFAPKLKNRDVVVSPYTSKRSMKMPANEPVSSWVLVSPLIATFVAVVVVTLLMSTSLDIEVSEAGYHSKLLFQTANLLALFAN